MGIILAHMDHERARQRGGIVLREDFSVNNVTRSAARAGLAPLQPGAWLASTTPVTVPLLVRGIATALDREHAFLGQTALWLYGVGGPPEVVRVGVLHTRRLTLWSPVQTSRVSRFVLAGSRVRSGCRVVRFEMAVVQACGEGVDALALLETVLRERRTTVSRLRATQRQGLQGSAVMGSYLRELRGGACERQVRELIAALERRGVRGLRPEARFVSRSGASCYADALHEPSSTALEVDGFVSHTDRVRFRADRRRDRWLAREYGVHTFRIDAAEIDEDVEAVADELAPELLKALRTKGHGAA